MAKTPKLIIQKATAFQLNPDKAYILHMPTITEFEDKNIRAWFADHGINDVMIVFTDEFEVTEVPPRLSK